MLRVFVVLRGGAGGRRSGPHHWAFSEGERGNPSIQCCVMNYEGAGRVASLLKLAYRRGRFDGGAWTLDRRADPAAAASQTIRVVYSNRSRYKMRKQLRLHRG